MTKCSVKQIDHYVIDQSEYFLNVINNISLDYKVVDNYIFNQREAIT